MSNQKQQVVLALVLCLFSLVKSANITVLSFNMALTSDTSSLDSWIQTAPADVVAFCQQESSSRSYDVPKGWREVFHDTQTGMTKITSGKLAVIHLSVMERVGGSTAAMKVLAGGEKVSISGKGSVWAQIQLQDTATETCGQVVVVCTHLPTALDEREDAVLEVMEDISEEYSSDKECDDPKDDGNMPAAKCWDSLDGLVLTGDINYRLNGKYNASLNTRAAVLEALKNDRWTELQSMDTTTRSVFVTKGGFKCNVPDYAPTYKLNDPVKCAAGDREGCYLPDPEGTAAIPMKEDEMQLGWLDRACYFDKGSKFQVVDDQALHSLAGEADHAPVAVTFAVENVDGVCVTNAGVSTQPVPFFVLMVFAAGFLLQ